jgi:DNA-binding LytR/AlgR family response regulator
MFQVKMRHLSEKEVKERLHISDSDTYKYVLTDDKDLTEVGKISIVFQEHQLPEINRLIDYLVLGEEVYLMGYNERGEKRVDARNILYFSMIGDDLYAIMMQTKLIMKYKLYELEELLENKGFIRTSKHAIVNMTKINYIKPAINSKIELEMINKEIIEVNRSYLKSFKEALKN